jgi:hypothetical protein
MRAENDTNDPIVYDQSGGGGDEEEPSEAPGSPSGRLDPGHTSQPWVPRGRPPWSVQFTDTKTSRQCTVSGISNPNATVTINSFNPCDGSHS